uniref:Uncharacterized protein n=1 Tax=Timema monikensis TaxID=170555 RepID=A0A7R9E555_9NEOP|nr:unnamed protein product [Timema monikensis]
METCDISLVKQEIVELIKTEPQNENEFDTCGQLGIKTEDESDTSNSVDEIVKTEINLYDSSFGTIDSNIDHFTPVDKSEDIVVLMEEDCIVKLKIVPSLLMLEDIVLHMVEEENVKLKIVLRMLICEDIVVHTEEEGNDVNSYFARFEHFCTTETIAVDVRVAWLLRCIGPVAYQISTELCSPVAPGTKTFVQLKTLLETHYAPTKSVYEERSSFSCRKQRAGESYVAFSLSLRHLAATCSFGTFLDDALKSQFYHNICRTSFFVNSVSLITTRLA